MKTYHLVTLTVLLTVAADLKGQADPLAPSQQTKVKAALQQTKMTAEKAKILENSATRPVPLVETLERAYMGNTDLDAARAGLRATDEDVSIAFSDWRPSVSAVGEQNQSLTHQRPGFPTNSHQSSLGYTVQATQNVYAGGRTVAQIGQAESNVSSGKAGLFVQEQKTLLDGIAAHTNIVANEQILKFQENNKQFTKTLLEQTQVRFEVGEISRTDVEVAKGNYERAVADLTTAIGNLETSKATYLRITGVNPGPLAEGTILLPVPDTYEEALEIAKKRNPAITQAYYLVKAAEYYINVRLSELLPQLNVTGQVGNSQNSQTNSYDSRVKQGTAAFKATLEVPLYLKGRPNAEVRKAYQQVAQAKVKLVGTQREVVESTRAAWENLLVARDNVKNYLAQVKAEELSVEGAVEELDVGSKSVIDVLLQQQKLVNAQINLAKAQKALVDANYQVLQAMGRLTACDLKLNVKTYDPDTYYNEYQDAWIQFWEGEDLRYVKEEVTQ